MPKADAKIIFFAGAGISLIVLCAGASLGSSGINPAETFRVLAAKIFQLNNIEIEPRIFSIIWELRLPRTILAFIAGGSLAISGAVFQSVLKNQLASPYILGVSSGASLGAALVMIGVLTPLSFGFLPSGFLFPFILPLSGFIFSFLTILAVIVLSSRLDKTLSNNTIILFGMVFSLFVNAILTTLLSVFREELKNLLLWQLGSFVLRGWNHIILMLPFLTLGFLGIIRYTREMDILSFGENEGQTMGVNSKTVRIKLFLFASLLTGATVALCGAIGFVDLIAPHAARRIIGSRHRLVIPLSFCTGGILMVTADSIARTVISPSELPVGAVTALIGAPFFAWIYFGRQGKKGRGQSPAVSHANISHSDPLHTIVPMCKKLEIKDLYCGYGNGDILQKINLKVPAGEFMSIAGPNGCGKSTLLKAIIRLLPYRGSVTVNGKNTADFSQKELAKNIALLGQITPLYFPYTVYDTVAMGRYAYSKDWFGNLDKADKTAIEEALTNLDLNDLRDTLISELSGGQLQRVFLARTLAQDPEIILLDEPTNHLDIKNQTMLLDYLKTWASGSRTIIAVFHDLNLACRYSGSAVLLSEGKIAASGSPAEVFSGSMLADVYGLSNKSIVHQSSNISVKHSR